MSASKPSPVVTWDSPAAAVRVTPESRRADVVVPETIPGRSAEV